MDSPHFPRWAHASIAQYLKAVANTNSITSLVEGIEDRTDTFMEADERVEFRVNGPLTYQPSNNYDIDTIYVNILATSLPGRRTKNRWQHHITIGVFYEALRQPIPLYKLGDGPDDDESHIGCLVVINGRNLGVRVSHFSQIDPTDRVKQAMITATYRFDGC